MVYCYKCGPREKGRVDVLGRCRPRKDEAKAKKALETSRRWKKTYDWRQGRYLCGYNTHTF